MRQTKDRAVVIVLRKRLSVSIVVLSLGLVACDRPMPPGERVSIRGVSYELSSAASATPADLTGAELVGCSDQERLRIAQCLGRIPAKNLRFSRVEVAWGEEPIAARVEGAPDCTIFLVKEPTGAWRVKGSILSNPHDIDGH